MCSCVLLDTSLLPLLCDLPIAGRPVHRHTVNRLVCVACCLHHVLLVVDVLTNKSKCKVQYNELLCTPQVFVHSLRKVDVTALVGQSTTAAVAVRGGTASRTVSCYSSHPDELHPLPQSLVLPAGGLTELALVFEPLTAGRSQVLQAGIMCAPRNLQEVL